MKSFDWGLTSELLVAVRVDDTAHPRKGWLVKLGNLGCRGECARERDPGPRCRTKRLHRKLRVIIGSSIGSFWIAALRAIFIATSIENIVDPLDTARVPHQQDCC